MAQCNAATKLALCFELLEKVAYYPQLQGLPAVEVLQMVTGMDPFVCPHCKKGRFFACEPQVCKTYKIRIDIAVCLCSLKLNGCIKRSKNSFWKRYIQSAHVL